jgi:hypothetical protein
MTMTVGEAYRIFKSEFPEISIKKSLFFQLRPVHVKLLSELPHNVCVCVHHANFHFLIDAFLKITDNFPANILSKVVCDENSHACMTNVCSNCNILSDFDKLIDELFNDLSDDQKSVKVRYEQWANIAKVVDFSDFMGLCQLLREKVVHFAFHTLVKREQSKCFQMLRQSPFKLVLQMDFSENYCLKFQDEIQVMHWINAQLTLFTCVAWGKSIQSFAIVSDELHHDKTAVLIYLDRILEETGAFTEIYDEVIIFTDGAASQFKNKYIIRAMEQLAKKMEKVVRWEFFATSHGKGAVDGIGGEVKRIVWDAVRSRQMEVTCLNDFVNCAQARTNKIKVCIC